MKVAVDLRSLVGRPSGIGWFSLALCRRLAERGRVRVLGVAQAEPFGAESLRDAGAEIEVQPAPLGLWWQQIVLPQRLRAGDVDLFWSPLFTLPLHLPVPAVVTIHDLTALRMPQAHRLKIRLSQRPFLPATLRQAARVVADSEATARDLCRLFPRAAAKVRVVYPGVDPDFRPAPPEAVTAIRASLGLPEGYVLFAGTLEPRKNVGLLLDAWQALRREGAPPLVVCGGYGWHSRELAERIASLEDAGVRDLGHLPRERLIEVMQAARAFVYPSLYEGFGLPVAEAMACGVPTLASRRSSLPEVVGDGGVLFDPDRPVELVEGLRRVLSDRRWARRLAELGRKRAARFDWDRATARMEAIFDETLTGISHRIVERRAP